MTSASENLSITVDENVPAEMRDGTVLRADVYRPTKPGSYPVLLCRTPYNKLRDAYVNTARVLASRGYTAVVQDIRGRFTSDGEFHMGFLDNKESTDPEDGYDAVEWAASLPSADGQVGTWGHSYPGWAIWRMAPMQPPSLKACFPSGMSARVLDLTFGVFETGRRLQWMYRMAADSRRRAGDFSGSHSDEESEDHWTNVFRGKWVWYLPLGDMPDYVLSTLSEPTKRYMREQNVESWAFDKIHDKINVPFSQITGWYDRLVGTVDNYAGIVEKGPASLKDKHRLIVGPWPHNNAQYTGKQGPVDFGPEADASYADMLTRWYDFQLKRVDNGLGSEPPVKLFIMGENRWRFEHEWPIARTQYTDFFLHSDGSANSVRGTGSISTQEPAGERPDEYDYDPRDPVMSMMSPEAQAAVCDQSPLDSRDDILVYQTPPLEQEIEVTGPVTLKLWAASDSLDTDFTAKLIDVHPDGLAVNLCYGIMRAQFRDGYDSPSLIEPGKPYEYTIKLMPTGILFRRGHRIRLDVASSDFPNFDRNHNTGADYWSDAEMRVAHQTVFHDRERPSRLVLPVIPR